MSWMKWPKSTTEKHSRPCQTPWAELPGRSAKWVAPAKPKPIGTHFVIIIYISLSYYDGYISLSSLSLLLYITFIIIIIIIILIIIIIIVINIINNIIVPIFWGDARPLASYFPCRPGELTQGPSAPLCGYVAGCRDAARYPWQRGFQGIAVIRPLAIPTSTNYMEV